MGIKENLKGTLAIWAAKAIDSKVDGRELAYQIEKELEATVGEKYAKKIGREQIANLLAEIIDGLFNGDGKALALFYAQKVVENANRRP